MARDSSSLPAVWFSEQWVDYFQANAQRLAVLPWETGAGLTPAELALVAESLPSWQLGESSDGAKLLAAARHYAASAGDPTFVDAIQLFIKEEQRHGADLGRFLDLAGVPRKTWDWGDAVFRIIRHLLTRMELSAAVLITVEVHALLYYAAIRRATGSELLRRLCEQVLRDEVPHIRFQCERLAILQRGRSRLMRALTMGAHRVLFAGVTIAIWVGHRRALKAGGFTFGRFWRTAWAKMSAAWRRMDPRAYRWPTAARGARSILEFGE